MCRFEVLQAAVKGPCLHRPENWLVRQLSDLWAKIFYMKYDLLERKERLQLEQCSRARKPVAPCSGEGWGFYGCFNSGSGGFFSLAVDSRAFLDELVCCPLMVGGTILRAFCSSALWQICETLYLLFRVQECRFTPPSQGAGIRFITHSWDAGMQICNSGCTNHSAFHGEMGYSLTCPLGLQTQQFLSV
jgi:hypothetical protein